MKSVRFKYLSIFLVGLILVFVILYTKSNIIERKTEDIKRDNKNSFTTKKTEEQSNSEINKSENSSTVEGEINNNYKESSPTSADKKILNNSQLNPEKSTLTSKDDEFRNVLQIKPQVQEVWYYCAPTTVSMMLSAKGVDINQYILAKEMGTYEPYGTHNKDAIRILNKYMFGYEFPTERQAGYRLENVTNVEQELPRFKKRLIENIKAGYPMYYTIDVSKIYPGKYGEHNVIGIGYKLTENKDDIEYVYYLDPSPSVQDSVYGGLKTITPRELLTAALTCGEPNYAW